MPIRTARRAVLALAAAGLIAGAAPAAAQTVVEIPLGIKAEQAAEAIWQRVKHGVSAVLGFLTPPSPGDFAEGLTTGDEVSFWSLLGDAGYKLKEVETNVGLIPGLSTSFQLARELTEADRDALERNLDRHTLSQRGLVARLERSIIHVLLEASEMGKYKVEKLEVVFLPLPKAKFLLTPTANVLSEDHDALMRAIQDLKGSLAPRDMVSR